MGRPSTMLNCEQHSDEFHSALRNTLQRTGHWSGEIWQRRKDGEEFLCWLELSEVTDREGNRTHWVGVLTDITYDLRQRLTSVSVGGQTTSYTYDAAGQLTRVTLPDASFVAYSHDDAHRITAVTDNKGNRIDYTLINTSAPLDHALFSYLSSRERLARVR